LRQILRRFKDLESSFRDSGLSGYLEVWSFRGWIFANCMIRVVREVIEGGVSRGRLRQRWMNNRTSAHIVSYEFYSSLSWLFKTRILTYAFRSLSENSKLVLIVTINRPIKKLLPMLRTRTKKRPIWVTGKTSPYPTVVDVTKYSHQLSQYDFSIDFLRSPSWI
jgi:hypothetical protein